MDKLINTEFSFTKFFIPLTNFKALSLLFLIGIIVYFNSLFNQFAYDDLGILQFSTFKTLDIIYLFGPNDINTAGYYRPLSGLYFSILNNIFHHTAFFYHLSQLSLHFLNTSLLFLLFTKFFSRLLSFILALFFLIHPINVESVAYIGASQSVLFTAFGLLALLLNIRPHVGIKTLVLSAILLLSSILVKEPGMFFIFIIFIYRFLVARNDIKRYLVCFFIVIGIYLAIRFLIGNTYFTANNSHFAVAQLSTAEKLMNIPAIIFYYLKTLIYPQQLFILQNWVIKSPGIFQFYLPFLIEIASVVLLAITGRYLYLQNIKAFSAFLVFTVWFSLGIILTFPIFPLDMTVADRWFYFPFIGLLGLIGIVCKHFFKQAARFRSIALLFVCLLLSVYSIRTVIRTFDWADNLTLLRHDVKEQNNYILEADLAGELSNIGQYNEALTHAQKSIKIHPTDITLVNTAIMYEKMGDIRNAISSANAARQIKSYKTDKKHMEDTDIQISRMLLLYADIKNAIQFTENSIIDYPNSTFLKTELAIGYYKQGNIKQAREVIKKAYAESPYGFIAATYTKVMQNKPVSELLDLLDPHHYSN